MYRDENLSAEGESTQSNEDLDIKVIVLTFHLRMCFSLIFRDFFDIVPFHASMSQTGKKENHVETSRLKFMLVLIFIYLCGIVLLKFHLYVLI